MISLPLLTSYNPYHTSKKPLSGTLQGPNQPTTQSKEICYIFKTPTQRSQTLDNDPENWDLPHLIISSRHIWKAKGDWTGIHNREKPARVGANQPPSQPLIKGENTQIGNCLAITSSLKMTTHRDRLLRYKCTSNGTLAQHTCHGIFL